MIRKQLVLLLPSVLILIIPLVLQIYRDAIPLVPLWLVLFACAYGVYQYLVLIKPRFPRLDEVTACEDVVKTLLSCVEDELYRKIESIDSDSCLIRDKVRLNIMLPLKGFFGRFIALRQFYSLGDYNDAEIGERWRTGLGNCGMSWREKRQFVHPESGEPFRSLPPDMSQRYEHLKSIISTPIRRGNDRVIGILNFDSTLGLDKTHFDDESVKSFAREKTRLFGRLLPKDGVKE